MLLRFPTLIVAFGIGLSMAQSPCPAKIKDLEGRNSCDFMEGEPGTTRFIFVIGMQRPSLDEENSAENREKLRRWTDSLFNNFDLVYPNETSAATSPPDSLLNWETDYLSLSKATVLAIADLGFVKWMQYSNPQITSVRPMPGAKTLSDRYGNYSVDGRRRSPARTDAPDTESSPQPLFQYRK